MIVWTPASGPAVTLCHGTQRGPGKATGPFREVLRAPAQVQVIQRIRAANAEPVSRGNRLYEYEFSTNEEFSTPAAALSALHGRQAAIGHKGSLQITNGTQTITYTAALIDVEDARRTGVNIEFTYRLTAKTQTIA